MLLFIRDFIKEKKKQKQRKANMKPKGCNKFKSKSTGAKTKGGLYGKTRAATARVFSLNHPLFAFLQRFSQWGLVWAWFFSRFRLVLKW